MILADRNELTIASKCQVSLVIMKSEPMVLPLPRTSITHELKYPSVIEISTMPLMMM